MIIITFYAIPVKQGDHGNVHTSYRVQTLLILRSLPKHGLYSFVIVKMNLLSLLPTTHYGYP